MFPELWVHAELLELMESVLLPLQGPLRDLVATKEGPKPLQPQPGRLQPQALPSGWQWMQTLTSILSVSLQDRNTDGPAWVCSRISALNPERFHLPPEPSGFKFPRNSGGCFYTHILPVFAPGFSSPGALVAAQICPGLLRFAQICPGLPRFALVGGSGSAPGSSSRCCNIPALI